MGLVKSVIDFYIHRLIGSWLTLVRMTLFLAEFLLIFWLKADYIFLHYVLAFILHPFLFDYCSFVVNIKVIACQCVYYRFIIPLGILSVSTLRVALGQLSCYKLLAMVFGVYSVYGANLPYTAL